MSNAVPMTTGARRDAYDRQPFVLAWRYTPRQARQLDRMAERESLRARGLLPPHGGTGVPVRKPLTRSKNGRGGRHHRAATDGSAQTPATSTVGAGPAVPGGVVTAAGGRAPNHPDPASPRAGSPVLAADAPATPPGQDTTTA
jgi:hypothetical protein